jgi:hypothetical protein
VRMTGRIGELTLWNSTIAVIAMLGDLCVAHDGRYDDMYTRSVRSWRLQCTAGKNTMLVGVHKTENLEMLPELRDVEVRFQDRDVLTRVSNNS